MKSILALVWVAAVVANGQVQSTSGIRAGVTTLISSSSGVSINDVTTDSSSSATSVSGSGTPTSTSSGNPDTSITTATPSVTAQLTAPLPSQAALPPAQAWCRSQIFCAGKVRRILMVK
jgi:hypothetical protein